MIRYDHTRTESESNHSTTAACVWGKRRAAGKGVSPLRAASVIGPTATARVSSRAAQRASGTSETSSDWQWRRGQTGGESRGSKDCRRIPYLHTLGKTMMIIMAKDDEDDEEKRKVKHEDVRRERIAKEKKRGPRTRRSGKRREALRHWQGLLLNKCPVTRTGPGTSPGTGQILPLRDTPSQQPRTV